MGHPKNQTMWVAYDYSFARDGGAISDISMTQLAGALAAGDVIKGWHGYCSETCVGPATTEVQTLTFGTVPDEGGITLTYGGETAVLAYDDADTDLEGALQGITGLGSVTVAGDFTAGFAITFTGVSGDAAALTQSSNTLKTSNVAVVMTITETTKGRLLSTVTLGNAGTRDGYAADLKALLVTGTAFNRASVAGSLLWDDTNDHPIDYLLTSDNAAPSLSIAAGALTAGAFKIIFEVYRP